MLHRRILIAASIACALTTSTLACSPTTDCRIGERIYRIRMPAGHDGKTPIGAIVFAHGHRGNVRSAVSSLGLAAMARQLNVAIISTKSAFAGWSLPNGPSDGPRPRVDELTYFDRVLDDAARRFPIDRKRLLMTGFSAGGMMVWHLACYRSHQFAAFVPIAGTFWRPVPESCATPTGSIVHIHGDADKVVPLEGRRIRKAHQGVVSRAIEMYARYGQFGAVSKKQYDRLRCELRENSDGHILGFCLYKGGHSFFISHIRQAWEMLVAAGRL